VCFLSITGYTKRNERHNYCSRSSKVTCLFNKAGFDTKDLRVLVASLIDKAIFARRILGLISMSILSADILEVMEQRSRDQTRAHMSLLCDEIAGRANGVFYGQTYSPTSLSQAGYVENWRGHLIDVVSSHLPDT